MVIRCSSKSFAAAVSDVRRLRLPPTIRKLRRVLAIFPKLKIVILEARPCLSPDFFEGVTESSLLLSKICFYDIGCVSSAWTCSWQGALSFPSVSQIECCAIGGFFGDALLNLLCCFPAARSVRLYDCCCVDEALLAQLSDRLTLLKDITVCKSSLLRSAHVSSRDMNLRHVNISMCPAMSVIDIPMSLMSIVLSATAVTDCTVSQILAASTALILLDVSHCHSLKDVSAVSSTLSILKVDYCSNLNSISIECPLLQSVGLAGCCALIQLVLHSNTIGVLDLTMLKPLKSIDLKCENLRFLTLCGCENLKYHGRYLCDDYKRMSLDLLLSSCPSLRFGSTGACLAGSPFYDEFINYAKSSHQNLYSK